VSAEFSETLCDCLRGRNWHLCAFTQQSRHGCGEGCPERCRLGGADERSVELGKDLGGKLVITACLYGHHTMAQAGERECMITHGAHVMLGLPHPPALDARARVQRVDDASAENVPRDRGRINEHASRRPAGPGLIRGRLAEDKPQPRAVGTELSRRCHRKVQLERAREQEHAVNSQTTLQVGESYRAEFIHQPGCPIIKNPSDRDTVSNAESQVQVGEAITATVHGKRTHDGCRNDPVILFREPEHTVPEGIALPDGEHRYPAFWLPRGCGAFGISPAAFSERRNRSPLKLASP
jgi:hypothetical protein